MIDVTFANMNRTSIGNENGNGNGVDDQIFGIQADGGGGGTSWQTPSSKLEAWVWIPMATIVLACVLFICFRRANSPSLNVGERVRDGLSSLNPFSSSSRIRLSTDQSSSSEDLQDLEAQRRSRRNNHNNNNNRSKYQSLPTSPPGSDNDSSNDSDEEGIGRSTLNEDEVLPRAGAKGRTGISLYRSDSLPRKASKLLGFSGGGSNGSFSPKKKRKASPFFSGIGSNQPREGGRGEIIIDGFEGEEDTNGVEGSGGFLASAFWGRRRKGLVSGGGSNKKSGGGIKLSGEERELRVEPIGGFRDGEVDDDDDGADLRGGKRSRTAVGATVEGHPPPMSPNLPFGNLMNRGEFEIAQDVNNNGIRGRIQTQDGWKAKSSKGVIVRSDEEENSPSISPTSPTNSFNGGRQSIVGRNHFRTESKTSPHPPSLPLIHPSNGDLGIGPPISMAAPHLLPTTTLTSDSSTSSIPIPLPLPADPSSSSLYPVGYDPDKDDKMDTNIKVLVEPKMGVPRRKRSRVDLRAKASEGSLASQAQSQPGGGGPSSPTTSMKRLEVPKPFLRLDPESDAVELPPSFTLPLPDNKPDVTMTPPPTPTKENNNNNKPDMMIGGGGGTPPTVEEVGLGYGIRETAPPGSPLPKAGSKFAELTEEPSSSSMVVNSTIPKDDGGLSVEESELESEPPLPSLTTATTTMKEEEATTATTGGNGNGNGEGELLEEDETTGRWNKVTPTPTRSRFGSIGGLAEIRGARPPPTSSSSEDVVEEEDVD